MHPAATTGGGGQNRIGLRAERIQIAFGQLRRLSGVAHMPVQRAAAGLPARHAHRHARPRQHANRRRGDIGIEHLRRTTDVQLDARPLCPDRR